MRAEQAVAEAQFGELLETQGAPLSGEDTDGARYDLKFRFWTNNQSRMYLIEGCAEVLKKYKLAFGDVIVFARKADGTLVLGGRPQGPVRRAAACCRLLCAAALRMCSTASTRGCTARLIAFHVRTVR